MILNLILAEDHNIVRNGIRMLLEADPEINICGEATNGFEVLNLLKGGLPADIVLADINMPGLNGIALITELKLIYPNVKVVILSMLDNDTYINQAFAEGAFGYLLKNVSADELIFSLKHVNVGGHYLCAELSMQLLHKKQMAEPAVVRENQPHPELSHREVEILRLIADGLTNTEMSDKLFISKRTIEGHRQNLIEKTGSRNTAALIRYAVLSGIVQ